MRQLSARVRWATVITATVAASTGCMSVGDDGEKPPASPSPEAKGSVAGPNGGTVAGTGGARTGGGGAQTHSEREALDRAASAEPGAPTASAEAPGGPAPDVEPGDQGGTRGGGLPAPSASQPAPGEPEQPVTPAPSDPPASEPPDSPGPEPEPEPAEPSPRPSASSAARFSSDVVSALEGPASLRTPDVAPQAGPV